MKKIAFVFLFSIISFNQLWAQNDLLDLIKEGKLEKADKKVDKILRKTPDDINANYCKALVLTQKDYSFYNPDSAYKYIVKTKELFSDLKDKTKLAELRKLKINQSAINKTTNLIYKSALERADADNTVLAYMQFLQTYPAAGDNFKQQAEDKMGAIYLKAITDTNSVAAYRDFIANHPASAAVTKAKERMAKLAFAQAEQANTKKAYKDFIDNYPQSKDYAKAQKRYKTLQYMAVMPADRWYTYKAIAETKPNPTEVAEARDSILAIARRYEDMDILRYCIEHFKGEKRDEAFLLYHDIYTSDGEKATLNQFYRGNADPLFKTLRVTDFQLAELGDSLKLEEEFDAKKLKMYDRYIKKAAPRERAFVALQKMMAADIAAKRWEPAIEKLMYYRSYFGASNKEVNNLNALLRAKADNSIKINSVGSGINTVSGGEYVPVITADDQTMYFGGKGRKDSIGGEDIYVSRKENNVWQPAQVIKELSFAKSNDAPLSVSADGTELLLFVSGRINYSFKAAKGGWSRPQAFASPINSDSWQADAMITSDGRALLFASTRNGGYGVVMTRPYHGSSQYNSDIYVSVLDENNQWGDPINLGPVINTRYADRMPFLHPDMKTLYFSSDGHGGLGGLDVYKSTRLADTCWNCWSEPVNLGKDINTDSHDWGYKISTDGDKAYFAKGNKGEISNDIYSVNLPLSMRPNMVATIAGKLSNMQAQALDAQIVWEDLETGQVMGQSKADPKDGSYFVVLPLGKMYGYHVQKDGYYPLSDNVDLRKEKNPLKVHKDIMLPSVQDMIAKGIAVPITNLFFNTNESVILPYSIPELKRVAAIIKAKKWKVEISGHTDNVGDAKKNQTLSEGRAAAVKDFLVKEGLNAELLTIKGYGATKPVADNKTEVGRAKNRRVELRIVK